MFLPRKILMIQTMMIHPLIKAPGSAPIIAECSHQQHKHTEMMIKYTRWGENESEFTIFAMGIWRKQQWQRRNWWRRRWFQGVSSRTKQGRKIWLASTTGFGKYSLNSLAKSYKKMKYNMKIYTGRENCSSLVAKICNKEIWHAHLTSKDRAKDLHLRKNSNSCTKKHQCHYWRYEWFSKTEK